MQGAGGGRKLLLPPGSKPIRRATQGDGENNRARAHLPLPPSSLAPSHPHPHLAEAVVLHEAIIGLSIVDKHLLTIRIRAGRNHRKAVGNELVGHLGLSRGTVAHRCMGVGKGDEDGQ